MIVVMSFHVLAGLRLFCADESLALFRAYGSNASDIATIFSSNEKADVSIGTSANVSGKGRTVPCSCKKKKKCPAIPRAMITSNPSHRSSEFQRPTKSEGRDSLIGRVTDRSFRARRGGPLLALAVSESFHSSTPLSFTCVLLI